MKRFQNLMRNGNMTGALKVLNEVDNAGIMPLNNETMESLIKKHPTSEPLNDVAVLQGSIQNVNPIIFDRINGDMIQKVAFRTKGAAGPSALDANEWRRILATKM